MLSIIALAAALIIIALSIITIRFVAPAIRERQIRESIALGNPVRIGRHRRVQGFGKHLAA